MKHRREPALTLIASLLLVGGCSSTINRLSEVDGGPKLSQIVNPTARDDYHPVSMPMPAPQMAVDNPNSLWRPGARAFFKDQRAKEVGDILTVSLKLDDSAKLENSTDRERDDSEDTGVPHLLGLESEFTKVLPQGLDPSHFITFGDDHKTKGDGQIDRKETIEVTLAAVVTQILPNGNLVIMGRQELRVNSELRELQVTGVIRPADIAPGNSISHTKIAEMRVAYGGRGTLSDLQTPRWGTQIWDIIFPF
jgi:flagellar L-ring protein precursor FlgH